MAADVVRRQLARELKEIVSSYFSEYRAAIEADQRRVLEGLKPGDVMPGVGKRILFDDTRAKVSGAYTKAVSQANAKLEAFEKGLNKVIAEPPTDEALRAIQAAKLCGNVSEAEIESLMDRYGSCYLARRAIAKLATDSGVYDFLAHDDIAEAVEVAGRVRKSIDGLHPSSIEHSDLSLDFKEWSVNDSIAALEA